MPAIFPIALLGRSEAKRVPSGGIILNCTWVSPLQQRLSRIQSPLSKESEVINNTWLLYNAFQYKKSPVYINGCWIKPIAMFRFRQKIVPLSFSGESNIFIMFIKC